MWRYRRVVPSIQVKNVPDDVHATLRRRAANANQSLQEYLLTELTERARQPTNEEVFARFEGETGGHFTFQDAVDAVHEGRRGR